MTQQTQYNDSLEESPTINPKNRGKKPVNIEEIVESLQAVGEDIGQISALTSQETVLVKQFFSDLLKHMQPFTSSIAVSPKAFSARLGKITQAHIESTGYLALTFVDGRLELKDLNEIENRDLLIQVIDDILPKLQNIGDYRSYKEIRQPPPVQKPTEPLIPIIETKPVEIVQEQKPLVPEVPITPPMHLEPEVPHPPITEAPVLEAKAPEPPQIDEAQEFLEKVLGSLSQLGSQVFTHAPISKQFNKWLDEMNKLISDFEMNPLASPDQNFAGERVKVFDSLKEEVAQKQLKEEELEPLTQELLASNEILVQLEESYNGQSGEVISKKYTRIADLDKIVHDSEEELKSLDQTKSGFFAKRAKEQRIEELTLKIESTKRKYDSVMESFGLEQDKLHSVFEKKKESAIIEMQHLQEEISSIETDNSQETRQTATNALSNAIKALFERKKQQQK